MKRQWKQNQEEYWSHLHTCILEQAQGACNAHHLGIFIYGNNLKNDKNKKDSNNHGCYGYMNKTTTARYNHAIKLVET